MIRAASIGFLVLLPALVFGAAVARGEGRGAGDDPLRPTLLERLGDRVDLGLETTFESAIETGSGRSQKLELLLEPTIEVELFGDVDLTGIARLRGDVFDRLEPGRPSQPEVSKISRRHPIGDHADFELRELYLQGSLGEVLFTVGKQQIVWGKADGLKVLDLVNPQDFREFILDAFEDSRIPLWALNTEILIGDFTAQAVWVVDPSYHDFPRSDALYAITTPLLVPPVPPGVTALVGDTDRPDDYLADSDAGLRLSAFLGGWDLTLNYLYAYDDFPILFRSSTLTPMGPVVVVNPGYRRTHLVGGTFSNAFGDLTVRGELGYSTRRFLPVLDPDDANGVEETGELRYVLGFDWYGFRDGLLSLQVFQTWNTAWDSDFIADELATVLTLLGRRSFWNETLKAEAILLFDAKRADGLLRPRLTYDLRDDLRLWAGVDLFFGTRRGILGQFDSRDRVVVGLQWNL